ncbi:MAG TPA: hypothetical protein VIV88_17370 [Gemmatimonadales bacterium]|jgi:hypothetical protein
MSRGVSRAALAAVAALACNDGLQPTPAPVACPRGGFVGICGTVTLRGTVPGNTSAVYIIAYNAFPQSRDDLFNFQPPFLSLKPLPLDRSSAFYTLALPSGRYEWVLAAWVDTAFTLAGADTTLEVAGFYRDGADTTPAGSGIVVVNAGGIDSIDFVIDFGSMQRVCSYFPPCP